ncbi:unnamed protein product [Hymenolepis diminuta]|uniref:Uncharacterized protein n=1 Tax=Hymenolepis diminuta TaxID=6216 RepID=A0A564Y9Q4_HYMDI|nr:unnamed protein product [Hymenolepis diminuta]
MFNGSLAFRRLSNEKAPKVFKFKSHEKKSDEFISSDEENEVASSEECLQAWIDRALKYWLSLESKVKAIAFIAPSDHIIQTIAWETGDAFKVSDVLEFAFELPRPEKVRNWFMEKSIQFIHSQKPVGEVIELRMNAPKSVPSLSGGNAEGRLMHKNVIKDVLSYFDAKIDQTSE